MKVFSVIYRPDIDTYYIYDREGKRILPVSEPPNPSTGIKYGFSFHDDYNSPMSVIWAEFMNALEVDPECEYFRQAEMGTGNMQDILARVTSYWLDRGKTDGPAIPRLVEWARENMVDPGRHTKDVSKLYIGHAAVAAIETVFARYIELVQGRQFQNWGHSWPNSEIIKLLELRILNGMKFKAIAAIMGRTNAACRAQYGRIRRGEDKLTVELQDWDIMREALPMGQFQKRKERIDGNSKQSCSKHHSEGGDEDRAERVLPESRRQDSAG